MDSDGDDKPPAPPVRLASHKESMQPPLKPLPSVPEHERKKKKFKVFLIGEDKCK